MKTGFLSLRFAGQACRNASPRRYKGAFEKSFKWAVLLSALSILFACGDGGNNKGNQDNTNDDPPQPDWVIEIDTAATGLPLNTALLGHYDLSGALYDYELVPGLVDKMQSIGFSDWRVSVGRWEVGTEMLPELTDGTTCQLDPLLATEYNTITDLVQARSWFIDSGQQGIRDGNYQLIYVRDVIDTALAFGADPFMAIDLMPFVLSANQTPELTECDKTFTNAVTNNMPENHLAFAAAVKGLVKRVVEGDGNGTGRPVTYWEVWNEPEFPFFWHLGLANRYEEFYDMAITALAVLDQYRQNAPDDLVAVKNLKFGLASFAGADTAVTTIEAFDTADTTVPMDFISFHSYHNDPLDIIADIKKVATAVNGSSRYQDVEMVLAEWASHLDTAGDAEFADSMQPPMIMSSVIAAGAALGLDRAHHSIFYNYHPGVQLGLIDNNGDPKPLYRAYQMLSEVITENSVMLTPANVDEIQLSASVTLLISRDASGVLRALYINRDNQSHTVRLEEEGGALTTQQIKVFDDPTGSITTQTDVESTVTLPQESLVLVEYQTI